MANAVNYSNTTPAAPAGSTNVTFQVDSSTTPNVSAYVPSQLNADWSAGSGTAQILNKPTIPAAQVNSDWTAGSGLAQILNKPTLGTAAAQNTTAFDSAGAATAAVAAIPVFGASGGSHSTGFVPDPGASAGTVRYLREDSTWATPAGGGGAVTSVFGRTGDVLAVATDYPAFVASGGSHAQGMVPDPGSTTGTTKFLREDATWVVAAQLNVANTWTAAQTINQTLTVGGGSGIRTTGLASGARLVTAATDNVGAADHTLILNGVTTENLQATPPSAGVELYLVNVSASAVTISGNGNSIWSAGSTTTTISLAAGATAILQWDYASTTKIWRQIK